MAHTFSIDGTAVALNQVLVTKERDIQQQLRVGLEFEREFTFQPTEHTYCAPNVVLGNTLQPYQAAFTSNNSETWDSVENTLEHGKADILFDAIQLEEAWDTLLANFFELDKSPDMWDYANYVIQNVVMPKLNEEINKASWSGVRVDPTPGTPGTYLEAWNGYAKVIADAITASSLTPIATGALVAGTMESQVRTFCAGLPEAYRFRPGKIYMSATRALQYAENYRTNHSYTSEVRDDADRPIYRVDFYNKHIVPILAMEGSDRMFFSPDTADNIIIGNRIKNGVVQSPYPRFRFQVFDRQLKCLAEMSRFYGFRYWGHLFVNDQA